ncbi:MAG: PAS domain S-box protein [Anaerolineaceae bacterium]
MKDRQPETSQTVQPAENIPQSSNSHRDLLQKAVESISLISASPISFFHFVEAGEKKISLGIWSSQTNPELFIKSGRGGSLSIQKAGKWADCIRHRRIFIQNNFSMNDYKDADPAHPQLVNRLLVTPVFRKDVIVAILGVANKPIDYSDEDGQMLSSFADLIWDLTIEKKQIEFYRTLMDITNDWETLVDEQNIFRYCSSNCEKITGYTCEEFNQNPDLYINMVHPEDRPAVVEHFREMHANREPSSLIFRVKTKTGEERWIELYCRAFYDPGGKYLGRRGSNRDVTERKQLEIALKKKGETLERSQRIAMVGSYEVDLQTNQIAFSRECYRILGINENETQPLLSETMNNVHPDDLQTIFNQLSSNNFTGSEFEITFRVKLPNGQIHYVQSIGKLEKDGAGKVNSVFGTIQDITDRKLIENELSDSEKRFRGVLDNASSMAVQGYAPDGTTQYWNQASSRLYGYSEKEALGKNLLDLIIPPEMREEVTKLIRQMCETGVTIPSAELSLMHKDGSRVEVYSSHTIVQRANHEPELFCIDLDLSTRKTMEAALWESEERFRLLVESISDIIFSIRDDGKVIYVTPTWKELFESAIDDALGMSFLTFIHPDELPGILNQFDCLLRTGEKIDGYQLQIKAKNGTWQWHSINASLIKETANSSRVIVGSMRNITEAKMAEQIRNAEVEIMNICHFANNKQTLLRELVEYFKNLTGFDAVGVRLHEGDDFPFFVGKGFSDDFLRTENSICLRDARNNLKMDSTGLPILDCMCGNILSRRLNPEEPCFTKFGSFYTNSTSDLAASVEKLNQLGITRNNCNRYGYESVAILPLHAHGKMFGLFQFNDHRRDRLNNGLIQQLENLVDYVSLALANLDSMEALRDSEEKYRILVDNASEAICVLQDGYCQFCNPKMLETSGYSHRDLPRKSFLDIIHPKDRHLVQEYLASRIEGKPSPTSIICQFLPKSGEIRWMELSTAPINWVGKPATLNFLSDITTRKNAQDALLNSEIKLLDMIDNFDGAIWVVDKDFKLIIYNSTYQSSQKKFFGREVSLGDDLSQLFGADEETNAEWRAMHSRVMQGEHLTIERKTGLPSEVEFVEVSYTPIRDAKHEIIGVTVMVRDITERKKAEQERRALEERFFNVFHTSPDSISINSMRDGIFIDVNEGFTSITGFTAEEVIGKSALQVNLWANPGDRERLIAGISEKGEVINLEVPTRTKNGEIKNCLISARKINVNREDCILMITRDISEIKLTEAKLNEQIEELRRWHAVTLGRENRIIDLKKEVNELLIKVGKAPRYVVSGESPHA